MATLATSTSSAGLSRALAELLAVCGQRWVHHGQRSHTAPVLNGYCAWCGEPVYSSRFGRRKLYCKRWHQRLSQAAGKAARIAG